MAAPTTAPTTAPVIAPWLKPELLEEGEEKEKVGVALALFTTSTVKLPSLLLASQ